ERLDPPFLAGACEVRDRERPLGHEHEDADVERHLLRILRPELLRLLEVLQRLVLHAIHERLLARLELLARLAEVLPLGLCLLVLRGELLLDLACGLRPRGAGEDEGEGEGGGAEDGSHAFTSWCGWPGL